MIGRTGLRVRAGGAPDRGRVSSRSRWEARGAADSRAWIWGPAWPRRVTAFGNGGRTSRWAPGCSRHRGPPERSIASGRARVTPLSDCGCARRRSRGPVRRARPPGGSASPSHRWRSDRDPSPAGRPARRRHGPWSSKSARPGSTQVFSAASVLYGAGGRPVTVTRARMRSRAGAGRVTPVSRVSATGTAWTDGPGAPAEVRVVLRQDAGTGPRRASVRGDEPSCWGCFSASGWMASGCRAAVDGVPAPGERRRGGVPRNRSGVRRPAAGRVAGRGSFELPSRYFGSRLNFEVDQK